mmetsp:Transcript_29990/g.45471  ORF Transcript_29990/g.45471 Transcript_29990/m.45471 type:complete len:457 (+) Transcript_29990:68-1438(+)
MPPKRNNKTTNNTTNQVTNSAPQEYYDHHQSAAAAAFSGLPLPQHQQYYYPPHNNIYPNHGIYYPPDAMMMTMNPYISNNGLMMSPYGNDATGMAMMNYPYMNGNSHNVIHNAIHNNPMQSSSNLASIPNHSSSLPKKSPKKNKKKAAKKRTPTKKTSTAGKTEVTPVKQELPSSTISTPQQAFLTQSLQAMGFEIREIEQAIIAKQQEQCGNVSVDDCMMWIVWQREQHDEAQKMDQVRAVSEFSQNETNQKQKQETVRRQLDTNVTTNIQQWTKDFFPSSIVLSAAAEALTKIYNTNRKVLVEFCNLEQKIISWYRTVPWCYLTELAQQWRTTSSVEVEQLRDEINKLQTSIYTLSEQTPSGIPKLFWNRLLKAEQEGKPTGPPAKDEDDDVCVIVLNDASSKKDEADTAKEQTNGKKAEAKKKRKRTKKSGSINIEEEKEKKEEEEVEIFEIL